jgi:hypothetical protein
MSWAMAIGPRAAVVFALRLVRDWCFFVEITSDVASFDLDRHPFREVGRASSWFSLFATAFQPPLVCVTEYEPFTLLLPYVHREQR